MTVFLNTHNLSEAEKLCNQVGVISKGKLLALGHPDEIRTGGGGTSVEITGRGFGDDILEKIEALPGVEGTHLQNGRLIVSLETDMDTAPLVRLLVTSGADVEEVRKGQASLEEAFLTLLQEEQVKK
jgi:ABC-2 type transport system ATP-binding protein